MKLNPWTWSGLILISQQLTNEDTLQEAKKDIFANTFKSEMTSLPMKMKQPSMGWWTGYRCILG